ncbi:MAG TPA: SIS domain-containing protein [Streptosporangiaceae bacterium]
MQQADLGLTEAEIASQPDCWRRAVALLPEVGGLLPSPGERVAVVGCGTSWFIAQCYAVAREAAGLGETDAFAASEMPAGRRYDRVLALSRSGTTTEILRLLDQLGGRQPTVAITADPRTPIASAADAIIALDFADEQSVVQTRFATSELALLLAHLGTDISPVAAAAELVLASPLPEVLTEVLTGVLPEVLAEVCQYTFLGTGWTVGLAHEAALKLRESAGKWAESYPAMEYRHGPIAVTAPGSLVWLFGPAPDGLADEVAAAGGTMWPGSAGEAEHPLHEHPLAELVRVHRVAVTIARANGLDPDRPRNLTRSVILS